ncbi:MAG: hypothetical protein ACM3U0_01605 [archaeon]
MKQNRLFTFIRKIFIPKGRKSWIIRIAILCIFLLLFMAYRRLDCFLKEMYHSPNCYTIKEAKERGVLLYAYKITPVSFTLPDGSKAYFKEVWVEKTWRFTNVCKNEYEVVPGSYNFNITLKGNQFEKMNKLYGYNWFFVRGNDDTYGGERSGNGPGDAWMQMYEDAVYPNDTLRLIVFKGFGNTEKKEIKNVFVVQKTSAWK